MVSVFNCCCFCCNANRYSLVGFSYYTYYTSSGFAMVDIIYTDKLWSVSSDGHLALLLSDNSFVESSFILPFCTPVFLSSIPDAPGYYAFDLDLYKRYNHTVGRFFYVFSNGDEVDKKVFPDSPTDVQIVTVYKQFSYIQISDGYKYSLIAIKYTYELRFGSTFDVVLVSEEELFKTPSGVERIEF